MQISAPIYVLKRNAKHLARKSDMALHQALDTVAQGEGYKSWSHLAASTRTNPAQTVLSQLRPGDLGLIAARPGQGKTLLGLDLAASATRLDRTGFFFTLDFHHRAVADHLATLGHGAPGAQPVIDTSDDICADHIITRLSAQPDPALVVIDYLQLLDQTRSNPGLQEQMDALHTYVTRSAAICLVISQIDRRFDLGDKPMPDLGDIRRPNPLDLSVFNKVFFLHNGTLQYHQTT